MPKGIYNSSNRKGGIKGKSGVYPRTKSMKQSMSIAKLDCKYPNRKKPELFTKEHRQKMSERMMGNQYAWKNGNTSKNKKIKNSIEYRLWREAIFARDNWVCQKHGTKGGELEAHHINNFAEYPELRFAIDNGITLSKKAHKEFHKKYGNKNNTKEQLEEFLK